MEIKILCAKNITDNPADGIDNFTKAVFGRMSGASLSFYAHTPEHFKETGSIKSLPDSKLMVLLFKKPDYLWGIGHIRELFLVLLKSKKTKYIINFHTILVKEKGPWRVKTPWFLRKFLFSRADMVVCPSEFSAGTVRKYFSQKDVISILNGVDEQFFNPSKKNQAYLAEKYHIDFSKPLAVFAGTLQPRKRPDVFIEIARRCKEANFVMVGKRIAPYDFLSSAQNISNFQWIEKMPREDMATLFASSNLFLFPSLNEPSAAVILEAMASGCVPLLSASGGNGEFVNDGRNGYLIPVTGNEKEEFLGHIKSLLGDEKMLINVSSAARARAEENTIEKTAMKYLGIFHDRS